VEVRKKRSAGLERHVWLECSEHPGVKSHENHNVSRFGDSIEWERGTRKTLLYEKNGLFTRMATRGGGKLDQKKTLHLVVVFTEGQTNRRSAGEDYDEIAAITSEGGERIDKCQGGNRFKTSGGVHRRPVHRSIRARRRIGARREERKGKLADRKKKRCFLSLDSETKGISRKETLFARRINGSGENTNAGLAIGPDSQKDREEGQLLLLSQKAESRGEGKTGGGDKK